jgi:hypothetical protein
MGKSLFTMLPDRKFTTKWVYDEERFKVTGAPQGKLTGINNFLRSTDPTTFKLLCLN